MNKAEVSLYLPHVFFRVWGMSEREDGTRGRMEERKNRDWEINRLASTFSTDWTSRNNIHFTFSSGCDERVNVRIKREEGRKNSEGGRSREHVLNLLNFPRRYREVQVPPIRTIKKNKRSIDNKNSITYETRRGIDARILTRMLPPTKD